MRSLQKLKESSKDLADALKTKSFPSQKIEGAALSKLFEVAFEYAWKSLKDVVQEHGLEAYSPRDVIKAAGQMGILKSVESWLEFLEDRNLSVHDYIGIEQKEYRETIEKFSRELRVLIRVLESRAEGPLPKR